MSAKSITANDSMGHSGFLGENKNKFSDVLWESYEGTACKIHALLILFIWTNLLPFNYYTLHKDVRFHKSSYYIGTKISFQNKEYWKE